MKKNILLTLVALVALAGIAFAAGFDGNYLFFKNSSGGDYKVTPPGAATTMVGTDSTQTLTNKTLTNPTLTTPTIGVATATSITGLSGQLTPASAGGINVGNSYLPFSGIYIGNADTSNARITGTFTAARTVTVPDATITVSGLTARDCRATATCENMSVATNGKLVFGSVTLVGGTATVSSISPIFTATDTFVCHATSRSATFNVTVANVSTSSFSITSASDTDTSVVNYFCIGR